MPKKKSSPEHVEAYFGIPKKLSDLSTEQLNHYTQQVSSAVAGAREEQRLVKCLEDWYASAVKLLREEWMRRHAGNCDIEAITSTIYPRADVVAFTFQTISKYNAIVPWFDDELFFTVLENDTRLLTTTYRLTYYKLLAYTPRIKEAFSYDETFKLRRGGEFTTQSPSVCTQLMARGATLASVELRDPDSGRQRVIKCTKYAGLGRRMNDEEREQYGDATETTIVKRRVSRWNHPSKTTKLAGSPTEHAGNNYASWRRKTIG